MVLHGLSHRPKIVNKLLLLAKRHKKRIMFPEGDDLRVLEGAVYLGTQKIVSPYFIGDKKKILANLAKLKLDASVVTIIDMKEVADYSSEFISIRKSAGVTVTLLEAKQKLTDPMWAATFMLKHNLIDGIVYGATKPTADTLRPALQIIGLAKNVKWASSYFMMIHEKRQLFFADCAFNINPNAEQLAQIAIVTHDTAKFFGLKPKVAMLSFSTKGSAKHPDSQKVADATNIVKNLRPDIVVDGELQFDAAVVPAVAKQKAPGSPIIGDANVFVFPNLDSGNIAYKIAQRFAHDLPIGPITQGFARPVNDLSRGCTVDEIIEVGAITAIQAVAVSSASSASVTKSVLANTIGTKKLRIKKVASKTAQKRVLTRKKVGVSKLVGTQSVKTSAKTSKAVVSKKSSNSLNLKK
jgi:phosphate acetyltransferase